MQLQLKHQTLDLSRPQIMGILNVTPDSFSDGGTYTTISAAVDHCARMLKEGADIIDIGGESTRPYAPKVSPEEELARVIPVVEALRQRFAVPLSLDTSTVQVMTAGIAAGADMINDIRALSRPGALEAAAALQVPVCLMHMQGTPQSMQVKPHYDNVVAEVLAFLRARAHACERAGIKRENIILDPGFGFGKSVRDNYALLNALPQFATLPYALLIGLSRKSMIGAVIHENDPKARVNASAAAAMLCAERGAHILRVHDVKVTAQMLAVLQAVKEAACY